MPSEVAPGDSMDRTHAAIATVAFPAWDLVAAASIVAVAASIAAVVASIAAVVASVVVVEAFEVAAAEVVEAEVAAVVAGKCCES
jgi:hypothetical protein